MTVRDRVLAWLQGDAPTITHRVSLAMAAHIAAGETYKWVGWRYDVAPSTVLRNVRRIGAFR